VPAEARPSVPQFVSSQRKILFRPLRAADIFPNSTFRDPFQIPIRAPIKPCNKLSYKARNLPFSPAAELIERDPPTAQKQDLRRPGWFRFRAEEFGSAFPKFVADLDYAAKHPIVAVPRRSSSFHSAVKFSTRGILMSVNPNPRLLLIDPASPRVEKPPPSAGLTAAERVG